jgi:uncharacterized protein HemY
VQALWAMRRRRWAEAKRALDEAIGLSHDMPYPYAKAKTFYVFGQVWATRGEPALARLCFEEALAICHRLGERLYRDVIELRLRA